MAFRPPFKCLASEDLVSGGSYGTVFRISDKIVLKTPLRLDDEHSLLECSETDFQALQKQSKRSIEAIENEKAIYSILAESPHPHLLQCLVAAPEGIFLECMDTRLDLRMSQEISISLKLKYRWLVELTSAAAWLESLGIAHGDIRPPNILLCSRDHLKLADFDCAVKVGEPLKAFSSPFWIDKPDGSLERAGPQSEQFAIGCCLYGIFCNSAAVIQVRNEGIEFPDTGSVHCGPIMRNCWDGKYATVGALACQARRALWKTASLRIIADYVRSSWSWGLGFPRVRLTSADEVHILQTFCYTYLRENRRGSVTGWTVSNEESPVMWMPSKA